MVGFCLTSQFFQSYFKFVYSRLGQSPIEFLQKLLGIVVADGDVTAKIFLYNF